MNNQKFSLLAIQWKNNSNFCFFFFSCLSYGWNSLPCIASYITFFKRSTYFIREAFFEKTTKITVQNTLLEKKYLLVEKYNICCKVIQNYLCTLSTMWLCYFFFLTCDKDIFSLLAHPYNPFHILLSHQCATMFRRKFKSNRVWT